MKIVRLPSLPIETRLEKEENILRQAYIIQCQRREERRQKREKWVISVICLIIAIIIYPYVWLYEKWTGKPFFSN